MNGRALRFGVRQPHAEPQLEDLLLGVWLGAVELDDCLDALDEARRFGERGSTDRQTYAALRPLEHDDELIMAQRQRVLRPVSERDALADLCEALREVQARRQDDREGLDRVGPGACRHSDHQVRLPVGQARYRA